MEKIRNYIRDHFDTDVDDDVIDVAVAGSGFIIVLGLFAVLA